MSADQHEMEAATAMMPTVQRQFSRGLSNVDREILLQNIFKKMDNNQDGRVDRRELRNALEHMNEDCPVPVHVLKQIFNAADKDNDGGISYNEFVALANMPKMRQLFTSFFHIPPMKTLQKKAVTYRKSCKLSRPPVINLVFIIIQAVVFMIDHFNDNKKLYDAFAFVPTKHNEVYRYFTYSWVHYNLSHIVGNSIAQLVFGTVLEPVHSLRVALVFIIGVLAGSLTSFVFDFSTILGASGGAWALICSWLADCFLNWSEQTCPCFWVIIVIAVIICEALTFVQGASSTSLYVHLAGGVAGALIGIIILKNLRSHRYERIVRWIAIAVFGILCALLIFANVFDMHTY